VPVEVSLDLGVHPVEAEGRVERRSKPGELDDVLDAGSFGRVDERALRIRQLGVRSGDHQHVVDAVQGGSKRLLTEHVAFDDLDGRRCAEARRLRGASDQRSHRLAPADELSDRGRPVQARSSCDKDHLITFSLTFPVNRSQKAG
jgi:hypothetical protein